MKAARPDATEAADTTALRRVASGEVGALGEVYDRHARSLLAFVARVAGGADAEDLVHTVFVRAARLAATYDGRATSARSWLFGIAAKVMQERRRSFTRGLRALLRVRSSEVAPAEPALGSRRDVEKALATLTEAKRVVVLLADLEGFTCEEIARMLDIPVGTVWTRLYHARRELRAFCEGAS
ncbi:MAG TPA: RNA polymerase sigma factor [Polyangia bacterium]|nr:RNA polymerase sigma factor [Polyangia bacterium]